MRNTLGQDSGKGNRTHSRYFGYLLSSFAFLAISIIEPSCVYSRDVHSQSYQPQPVLPSNLYIDGVVDAEKHFLEQVRLHEEGGNNDHELYESARCYIDEYNKLGVNIQNSGDSNNFIIKLLWEGLSHTNTLARKIVKQLQDNER